MVDDAMLLEALGIRIARGKIVEQAIWCGKHRILILDEDVTTDQVLAVADELLDLAA